MAETPQGPFQDLSMAQALAKAAEQHKLILVDFYTTWCGPCKRLDSTTWKDEKVIALLNQNAISLKIDAEKEVALAKQYAVDSYPTILVLKSDGTVFDRLVGYQAPDAFLASFQGLVKGITSLDRARSEVAEANKGDLKSQIEARRALARVLTNQEKYEEALKEYLWLYDEGMKKIESLSGVRNSFLLGEIERLAERYPPALAALRQRRDKAKETILAHPEDSSVAHDLRSLNASLKDEGASVETYDSLPVGSAGRKELGFYLWNAFIERKRYRDALDSQSPKSILDRISAENESLSNAHPMVQKALKSSWLTSLYTCIEALAGTGRLEEAKPLVKKALAIDPSPETHRLLEQHLQRSGKAVTLASLI
jgi:thiol-disulfide isomerase/thioredoxin